MDYLPRPDRLFLAWLIAFIHYLSTAFVRLKFPEDLFTDLLQQHADFEQKFQVAEDPSTHTPLTVATKNAARKLVEKTVRQAVKEYLINNHLLTEADFKGLGLPVHKTTHTPSPVAGEAPDYEIDSRVIRRLIIYFFARGSQRRKGKEVGQHGGEILWAIRDTPPTSIHDLTNSTFDTHSPVTFTFDEDQRGKVFYFVIRWENNVGEKGPWSEIRSAIIP
jgi:hypothetical protein